MEFCETCNNLCEIELNDGKIESKCKVCNTIKKITSKDVFKIKAEYVLDDTPNYLTNRNIIYDYTLPRVFNKCNTCKKSNKNLSEFVISQVNPLKYIVNKICCDCIRNNVNVFKNEEHDLEDEDEDEDDEHYEERDEEEAEHNGEREEEGEEEEGEEEEEDDDE